MILEIAFGKHTRVALDVGCGVASFGAYLLSRNVITLSVAPKDVHENQIQFALERGVPSIVAAFATRRLLYTSQAFDLIHCSRCRINWTRDDGILLLEVNRMLRAGGYFAWAMQPVYKHEPVLEEQWEEINMAAVASSHRLFYADSNPLISKGKGEQVLYHATGLSTPDHIMLEASVLFRKHTTVYIIPRNNRRLSRAIKASSNSEKHLKSLDSYLGKIHNDSKQTTLSQRRELIIRNNQLKAEDGLRLVEGYLGKVKESVDSSLKKDQESGRVRFSNNYMELKTDKVEIEQKSADYTSDFYIIGALASVNIAVFLFEIATPVKNSNFELFSLPLLYGAKINNLIITGEWWRLVTPMFLHSGIFHIALGIWILFTFGIKVSKEYGSFTFLFIYILGGITGNLISFLHTPEPTVGGTGPVFALIGAWLIYHVQNKDVIARDDPERMFEKAFIAAALICVLSNFGSIDDWSHFAATFTGVTYGFLTCPTLQVKDASSEAAQQERITLVRRYANPCISLVYFSFFLVLLSSLLFVIEPPLNLIE